VYHELTGALSDREVVNGLTSAEWRGFAFGELLKVLPLVESPLGGCAVADIGIMWVTHIVFSDDLCCCKLGEMFKRYTK
jgi:hypothetical protein